MTEKGWRNWSRIGLTILAAICSLAGDDAPQPPVRGRPAAFSGIVGAVEVLASATPTKVLAENPITYRLRLQGPPSLATLAAPDLHKIRGFDTRFAIRLLAERWLPQEKTREFEFELRPKNATVDAIPPFSFVFWVPGVIPPEGGYQTRFSQAIPIKVTPRPSTPVQSLTIEGNPLATFEQNLEFDFDPHSLEARTPPWRPSLGELAILALVPPVLVWFRVRKWWGSRGRAGVQCLETGHLARNLAAIDLRLPDADDKVRQVLDSNRSVLGEKFRGFHHGQHCRCRELLGAGRAYLYGGARREVLSQLVQEARSIAAREEGGES